MICSISQFFLLLLLVVSSANLEALKICRDALGVLYAQNDKCYYLIGDIKAYYLARSQCVQISSGSLVTIQSAEEDNFIKQNVTGFPFWIGLSDIATENEFRWEGTDAVYTGSDYSNWEANWEQSNTPRADCVFYNADRKWQVQDCSFDYAYLCKFNSCESNDGIYCIGEAPTSAPEPLNIVPIVAIIIVLVIIILIVVFVILFLFYLYKKQNDVWKRLCSCFTFKQTKQKVHGLEQENFRLRKELGNLKHDSINLSGSQSINRPRVISSIPDGQGGMLPSIHPRVTAPVPVSTYSVPLPVDPSKPGPPPLAQNTSLLQSSMNYSIRSNTIPTPLPQPNMNSSITSDQIAGILWSQQTDFQVPKKPSMNSSQQNAPSRSIFQSPYPTVSTPFSFPNTSNPVASPFPEFRMVDASVEASQKNGTQGSIAKPTGTHGDKEPTPNDEKH